MRVKLVKRFLEEMPKRDDYQNATESYQRIARSKTDDHQRTSDQLDYRDDSAYCPKRPRRQETIGVRLDKVMTRVTERAHLKALVDAGHKENESQDPSSKQKRPGPIWIVLLGHQS